MVIGPDGKKIGILSKHEALKQAEEHDLDLVLISKNGKLPVAKIINYNKFKFERKKKEEENRKKSKAVELKEIRISANIGDNDLKFKIKAARKFIEKKQNVKVSLSFRGREITNKENGYQKMNQFLEEIKDLAEVESGPALRGRFYDAYLTPIKKKK